MKLASDPTGLLFSRVKRPIRKDPELVAAREHLTVERQGPLLALLQLAFDASALADIAHGPREREGVLDRNPGSRQSPIEGLAARRLQLQREFFESVLARAPQGGQARAESPAIARPDETRERAAGKSPLIDPKEGSRDAIRFLDLSLTIGGEIAVGRKLEERSIMIERERRPPPPTVSRVRPERTERPPLGFEGPAEGILAHPSTSIPASGPRGPRLRSPDESSLPFCF